MIYAVKAGRVEAEFNMSNTFDNLSKFITTKMRMSHVYQPVMLIDYSLEG